jgi:hypothetical protein
LERDRVEGPLVAGDDWKGNKGENAEEEPLEREEA